MAQIDKLKEEIGWLKGDFCYFNCHRHFSYCLVGTKL